MCVCSHVCRWVEHLNIVAVRYTLLAPKLPGVANLFKVTSHMTEVKDLDFEFHELNLMLGIPVPPTYLLYFVVEKNSMCIYQKRSLKRNLLFIFDVNLILFPFIKTKYILCIFLDIE